MQLSARPGRTLRTTSNRTTTERAAFEPETALVVLMADRASSGSVLGRDGGAGMKISHRSLATPDVTLLRVGVNAKGRRHRLQLNLLRNLAFYWL
jgi:hypothetical protein